MEQGILIAETSSATFERHYTVAEVAEMWNLSKDAVRRLFQNEPGVVVLTKPIRGSKRKYRTLRLPQAVVERVHRLYTLV
jgi:transcriptional regulator GlxA family with amidase domain